LILCPEIGLTSQLSLLFKAAFDTRVVVLHSQLTAKEREKVWLTILIAKQPLVVIGPRSALFSPLANIGTVIIDEAHDQAYKQEQPPYYQATRAASQLRQASNGILVLGSATPSVSDYYMALAKAKPILRMIRLARQGTDAQRSITVIDLKDRLEFSRSQHISTTLISSISSSLEHNEQVLLYLNRRGTARVTLCNMCGWQALCPNCDLPLAYHGDAFELRCHTCGYHIQPPLNCPACGNQSIALKSFGTKAIVDEAQRLFPEARIMRFDTDSSKTERLEQQFERIISGGVDILVGTQMLAKGLDLPHLSTLGIIMADSSLYLPDYTATERTYQLLTQVIGRIGRGHINSRAIVQTYYPTSPLIQAALEDDWDSFYNREITERSHYQFPPFSYLLKLSCRRTTQLGAERTALKCAKLFSESGLHIKVEDPAPAFHEKASGRYQWQIVIKAKRRSELLKVLDLLPSGWSYDLDPTDLL
jgi:primosomal protein N' (replication factor Y)